MSHPYFCVSFRFISPIFCGLAICLSLCQCGSLSRPPQAALFETNYASLDGVHFPYQKWPAQPSCAKAPLRILIGIHGFNGYPGDFDNLAQSLQKKGITTYAPATRGQGLDPRLQNRGDIRQASQWIADLLTLTVLLREKHPRAQIIWCGESMGSLIALHAASSQLPADLSDPSQAKTPPCDLLILSSPIVGFEGQVSPAQKSLLTAGATLFPRLRFSATQLTGEDEIQMTQQSAHGSQSQQNPWHVEKQTLRLYRNLGKLIDGLPSKLQALPCPLLVLHGGKDHFCSKQSLHSFLTQAPQSAQITLNHYPNSHHLLFYDHEKKRIISDTAQWISGQPKR